MSAEKKKNKEDTWRPDELTKHVQGPNGENWRRERTKRDEIHRKQRSGESTDRRHRDPEREERKEREKQRERDAEEDRRRREERERRKEREREGERRGQGDDRENRDRENERQRERYKDRDRKREGELGREKERERHRERDERVKIRDRDREKERYRDIDRERGERHKDREREKDKERNRDKEKERNKYRERDERHRDREKDREKERDGEAERERRRAEKERRREMEEGNYREKDKEREREKREHRTEYSGHTDREERRERKRREKEHVAGERYLGDLRETEQDHRHRNGENRRLRERVEKDNQKEKRNEEMKKGGGDHRREQSDSKLRKSEQQISTKRPELSWKSNQAELSDPEIPMENEDNEDNSKGEGDYENEEYEEDFEDYEEDFEEMGEEDDEKGGDEEVKEPGDKPRELSPRRRGEVEAIQRAMQRENELVSSAHSRPSSSKAEPTQKVDADSESLLKKGRTHVKVIDFTAARQREVSQQAADRQKKRSAELLRLIDLDYSVTMCLLDLPPVSEYDMYIKSFGMANTKQAYVQCNEDNTDRDTQTEDTDTVDKWTQHPPETNVACGGPKASQDTSDDSIAKMNVDSRRLTTFLRSAAQVMAVLLEENQAECHSVKKLHSQTDSLSFSEGSLHLNTKLPLLQGRRVTLLHFSQVQTHTLLSVHAPRSSSSDEQLDSKTLICVWNIWEPSSPQRTLIYEAEVRCCCFSPGKATLVFAGTAVGSVVLWDLREHSGSHSSHRVGGEEWTLRHPTFSTDAVMSGAGHFSPVVSVEPVVVNMEPGSRGLLVDDQEESLGLLFQLGTLDENGLLNLWVVTELPKADDSGSQTDLGLRPGGKVKLLHSSSLQTSDRSTYHRVTEATPLLSLLLKFLPSDSNHYFIGTNMGVVRRGTRHGLRTVPKLYRPEDGERPADVTALDFSPSGEPFFLVGCSDGSVRLHSVLQEEPVMEWSTGSGDVPVLSVLWSRTRPSVFCVLDAASRLHIWDLTEKDLCPVISESFQTDRVTAVAVFGEGARQNRYSGLALALQSGRLEIHFLKPSLTVPQPSDSEKLHLLAQDI